MAKPLVIAILSVFLCRSHSLWAQDLESEPPAATSEKTAPEASVDTELESLYDKDDSKIEAKSRAKEPEKNPSKDLQTLSDLATLAPFEDVAIIQRRFLPKTGRFELSGSGYTNLNNPFFMTAGVGLRAAYYFREKYALEALLNLGTTWSREVTDDLEKKRGITTDNVVTSKGFAGVAFKWNPIYGKITWLNKSIVPFDLNFDVGLGMTQTTSDDSAPTVHLGTSQVFALSKSTAVRWDIMWNTFNATSKDSTGKNENVTQNDLFLGLGMSFYFPEATYR